MVLLKVKVILSVDNRLKSKGRKIIIERRKIRNRGAKETISAFLIIISYRSCIPSLLRYAFYYYTLLIG
jgi:hypothetical protein